MDEPKPISDEDEARAARLANRFDIRRLIGAVFLLYGLILTVLGVFGSSQVKNKAAGLNIDTGPSSFPMARSGLSFPNGPR